MQERLGRWSYPNTFEFLTNPPHFPNGPPPAEAAEPLSEEDFLSPPEHPEPEDDQGSSFQNGRFNLPRSNLPEFQAHYLRELEEIFRRADFHHIDRLPSVAPNLDINRGIKMDGNWGRVRFGADGGGVRVEGPVATAAALGVLLLQLAQAGNNAEINRREAALEREREEATKARREARERQREAEEATRRANEAEQAETQEREAREEAEHRAAEAARAEEQERIRREEAEKKAKHERLLREMGVEPDREIIEEEIRNARLAVGYVAGHMNIGVVGRQNEGKSTLVNSFRGVRPGDPGSAKVGEVETTRKPTAFMDERHAGLVWHDIPGGGTGTFSAWGYYYNHKLFAYDKILLVHTATLSELDIRVMRLCAYMNKECVVVRTKADVHIRSCMRRSRHASVEAAREDYLRQVWEDTEAVKAQTSEVETLRLDFTDFVISEMGVLQMVTGEPPSVDPYEQVIDEERLLHQLGL